MYSQIKGIRIVTGYSCNYRCSFCYQDTYKGQWISQDELEQKLNNLPIPNSQVEYVTVMGGEAMCDPEAMKKLEYIARRFRGKKLSLTTNGSGGFINNFYGAYKNYTEVMNLGYHLSISIPSAIPSEYSEMVGKDIQFSELMWLISQLNDDVDKIRINTYLHKNWWSTLLLAKQLGTEYTICCELREEKQANFDDFEHLIKGFGILGNTPEIVRQTACETIYKDRDGFEFWLYKFVPGPGEDNLIVVPDALKSNPNGLK